MFAIPAARSTPEVSSSTSAAPDNAVRHAKLTQAAQQFEAVMLGELMKPLGKSSAIGVEDEEQGSSGPLQSFGMEAVAGALAKSGALGFAKQIVASMEKHDAKKNAGKSEDGTKVLHDSTDNPRGGYST